MRWFKGIVFSLSFIAVVAGCGKDEKKNQEIQKAIQKGVQKESQMYEGMQKSIENLGKSVKEKQQGSKK